MKNNPSTFDEAQKPKLLVLTSTLSKSTANGEPRFVEDLCEYLSKNFEICILTQHRPHTPLAEHKNGVRIIRYRYSPQKFELLSEHGGISQSLKIKPWLYIVLPLFFIAQTFAIVKTLRDFKPDLIHAHWIIPQGLCCAISLFFIRKKPRVILTAHGGDVYGFAGKLFTKIKKWVVSRVDCFCVVSEAMKGFCQQQYLLNSNQVSVLPMGADVEGTFTPLPEMVRKTGQLAFVGRLVEKKGLVHLVSAIPELLILNPTIHLKIAGFGPDLSTLQAEVARLRIQKNVTFLGAISHTEIAKLYRESEIAVFPFIQAESGDMEGLGLVVIEAMGCMCPVIVGDVPAIRDTVEHGKTGLICDPSTRSSLVEAISRIQSDNELRDKLSVSAYQYSLENFSWNASSNRYVELFNTLLKS